MLFERELSGEISPYWGFYDISGVLTGYKNDIIIENITDINDAMIYLSNEDISSVTGNQYGFSVSTDANNRFYSDGVFDQPLFGVFKDTYYFIRDNNIYEAVYKWRYDRFDALALYGHISTWTIDGVTDMSGLFKNYEDFNEDLSGWNVSSVTNMSEMFKGTTSFDQPIGTWNVSNVYNMSFMFSGASVFNGDISGWDTGNVITMESMFQDSPLFDRPIGKWDTISVETMENMFSGATSFNQSLHNWSIDFSDVVGYNPIKDNVSTTNMLSNTNSLKFYILSGDVSNDNLYQAVSLYKTNKVEYAYIYKPIDQWNTTSITNMNSLFQTMNSLMNPLETGIPKTSLIWILCLEKHMISIKI